MIDEFRASGVIAHIKDPHLRAELAKATIVQNRMVMRIVEAIEREFPDEKFLNYYGGDVTPGQIVRGFLLEEETDEDLRGDQDGGGSAGEAGGGQPAA